MNNYETTKSSEINKIGKKYFGDSFLGALPADIFVNEVYPIMRDGDVCIVNSEDSNQDGAHWLCAIKDNGKLYMYDSYGTLIKDYNKNFKKIPIIQDMKDGEQKYVPLETNCAQRSLSSAVIYKKYGSGKFLEI